MVTVKELIGCKIFEPDLLFKLFNSKRDNGKVFDIEEFKEFSTEYENRAILFEKKTGIPANHFSHETNIKRFEGLVIRQALVTSYIKIKNVYAYFDGENILFFRSGRIIKKVPQSSREGFLLDELDQINIPWKVAESDNSVPVELNTNSNFFIKRAGNFFVRYYKDSVYDIVVKIKGSYFFFYDIEHIDMYTWSGMSHAFSNAYHISKKERDQIIRILKLSKILLKNNQIV